MAASTYNEGYSAILKIMNELNIEVGNHTVKLAKEIDNARIKQGELQMTDTVKQSKIEKRRRMIQQEEVFKAKKGIVYSAGMAD